MRRCNLILAMVLAAMVAAQVDAAVTVTVPPACIAWCSDAACSQPAVVSCVAFNKKAWPALFNVTANDKVKLSKIGATVTTAVDGELYVSSGRIKANAHANFDPFVPVNGVIEFAANTVAAVEAMCQALLNANGNALVNLAVGSVKIYATGQYVVECRALLSIG